MSETLEPAAVLAEDGFPVAANVAALWKRYFSIYEAQLEHYPVLKTWFDTFCPDGRPLDAGEIFKSPDHAKTLRAIAETNAQAFYKGEIADAIAGHDPLRAQDAMYLHLVYNRKRILLIEKNTDQI